LLMVRVSAITVFAVWRLSALQWRWLARNSRSEDLKMSSFIRRPGYMCPKFVRDREIAVYSHLRIRTRWVVRNFRVTGCSGPRIDPIPYRNFQTFREPQLNDCCEESCGCSTCAALPKWGQGSQGSRDDAITDHCYPKR